ncbi:MAG TPA: aminotransferase class V-fold PLP-dependent enzyme, partial [bacterium]|nr:aminotransferase class V-fold PLP-dependent enzyme [bacterium]
MLTCQRHLFSLPDDLHFLNCAQMSPLLKSVEQAGIEGIRRKSVPTRIQPADFFTESEALRGLLARLINGSPEQVALIPSASYGVALATHHVPLRPGQNVVLPGGEFPSDVYGWMERCRATGADLRLVPRPEPAPRPEPRPGAEAGEVAAAWNARLLEAIDERTAVVGLAPLHWTDGTPFDLLAIGRRAREVGAWFILDGTQSFGALPFDFQAVQPDLAVCAGYKWLLGPYQYGFAAVGPRLLEAAPLEMNWITRANSEDFTRLTQYQTAFQPGARRFDAGERSNFILVPMLAAAVQ